MKQKLFTQIGRAVMAVALGLLTFGLSPQARAAQDPVNYMTWDDTQKMLVETTCTSYTLVTKDDAEWGKSGAESWYVVEGNITIKKGTVTCKGAVHLILKDDAYLTVSAKNAGEAGICVSGDGNSLTVYGQSGQTGFLTASGKESSADIGGGAGIGGGNGAPGSNITINGGIVYAEGGYDDNEKGSGAGIGGGAGAQGSNITINGGTVTATGGEDKTGGDGGGAGIGGGTGAEGSNITINGGTVTAKGGRPAAGIGGGSGGNGSEITINGGTVKATGGCNSKNTGGGAGIGGGSNGTGSGITISGGTVTAKVDIGGTAAAIGGGSGGEGTDITIKGGTVTATGGEGAAGIGGGTGATVASSNIKVSPLMLLKAGASENPTTVIRNTGADLAEALKGQRYATTAAVDYTLVLKGGEAYKGSVADANKITEGAAAAGLAYADGAWTMSNFVFTTSARQALDVEGETTIKVVGQNSLHTADSTEYAATYGIYSATNLTILGGSPSDKLNVSCGVCGAVILGFYIKGDLKIENVEVTASASTSLHPQLLTAPLLAKSLIVNNASVYADKAGCKIGVLIGDGKIGPGGIVVSGTGMIHAAGSTVGVASYSSTEPDATATSGEATLAWKFEEGLYTYFNGDAIATDVTLTEKLPDYQILLKDGVVYTNEENASCIFTEDAKKMGLSYDAASGVWTMKDFTFTTSANTALALKDTDTTITVSGTCSLATTSKKPTGINIWGNITINGDASGVNTLAVTLQDTDDPDNECDGIFFEGKSSFSIGDNVTVTVAVGRNVSAVSGFDTLTVTGSGKLIAQTDGGEEMTAFGGQTKNTLEESAPVWVWKSQTSGFYANIIGGVTNIATNVTLTAAPLVQIPSAPTTIEGTTYKVYTNGVESADGTVWSNKTAYVVYTAEAGYTFSDKSTVSTNALDTSVDPAVNKTVPDVIKWVKLSDVDIVDSATGVTNATATVYVDDNQVMANPDGTYTVPADKPIKITYTVTENALFGSCLKDKDLWLNDGITGDHAMTAADKEPVLAALTPAWADEREIGLDTRERIIVAAPTNVLPVAYSTNFWATTEEWASDKSVTVMVIEPSGKRTWIAQTVENGYVEWFPEEDAYGKYTLTHSTRGAVTHAVSNDIYYTTYFPLTIAQPAEGGTIAATTNGAAATGTFDILGYEYVNLTATPVFTPAARYEFVHWAATTNGIAYDEGFTNLETAVTRFEMPNAAAEITANFQWKSNYTESITVKVGETWQVLPGETYHDSMTIDAGGHAYGEGAVFTNKRVEVSGSLAFTNVMFSGVESTALRLNSASTGELVKCTFTQNKPDRYESASGYNSIVISGRACLILGEGNLFRDNVEKEAVCNSGTAILRGTNTFEGANAQFLNAPRGKLVWDFTEGYRPYFAGYSNLVNNRGVLQIAFDSSLTNGTYAIAKGANAAVGVGFEITNGSDAKDCTVVDSQDVPSADWTYVGAKRFKLSTDSDGTGTLTLHVESGIPMPLTFTSPVEGGSFTVSTGACQFATGTKVYPCEKVSLAFTPADHWQADTNTLTLVDADNVTNGVSYFTDVTLGGAAFKMTETNATVSVGFTISDGYRAALLAAAEGNYVATTNAIEQLRENRLTEAETDDVLMNALSAFTAATNAVATAYKPGEGDAATNTLVDALTKYATGAKARSDNKPWTITVDAKATADGTNVFSTINAAFAATDFLPYATNLVVIGEQEATVAMPAMRFGWNLIVTNWQAEATYDNTKSPYKQSRLVLEAAAQTQQLTSKLVKVTGEGRILLANEGSEVARSLNDKVPPGEKVEAMSVSRSLSLTDERVGREFVAIDTITLSNILIDDAVAFSAPTSALTGQSMSWYLQSDNQKANLANYDDVDQRQGTSLKILIDNDQAEGSVVTNYVIAGRANTAMGASFGVYNGMAKLCDVTVGGETKYVGPKAYSFTFTNSTDAAQSNLVFHVKWGKFAITYDAMGPYFADGTATTNIDSYVNKGYDVAPDPVREGYTFLGWYDGVTNGATKVVAGQKPLLYLAEHTLYAKWQPTAPSAYNMVMADTQGGQPVTTIGYAAYAGSEEITNLITGCYLTNICEGAFNAVRTLKTVKISEARDFDCPSNKVPVTIGKAAFAGTRIESLEIPAGTIVGKNAFRNCSYLETIAFFGDECNPSLTAAAFSACAYNSSAKKLTVYMSDAFKANNAAFVTALKAGYATGNVTVDVLDNYSPVTGVKIDGLDVSQPTDIAVWLSAQSLIAGTLPHLKNVRVFYRQTLAEPEVEYAPTSVTQLPDGSAVVRFTAPNNGTSGFIRVIVTK